MLRNCKKFSFNNAVIFFIAFFLISKNSIYPDTCHHCSSPAHESINERCRQCNRLLKDCTYFHTIIPPLTVDSIVNASSTDELMNILFKLRNLYKTGHNRVLPVHEIFTRGDDFFEQNGVVVPENVLRKLKDAVRRRDHNEIYVSRCVKNAMPEGFESTEEHQKMLSIAKSFYSDIDEIETPFRLDCGIFLTWAGGAMIVLSDGVLAPAGKWVAGLGIAMTLEGLIEYKERYDQFVQERDQREKLKIQEEARKAEKDARKKAEKAEKNRLREIEKQREKEEKAERRRQKEEKRKNESEKK